MKNNDILWGKNLDHVCEPHMRIAHEDTGNTSFVAAFRLDVHVEHEETHEIYVHAEDRYELFLNEERIGRGSERGDHLLHFCEQYRITLRPGSNRLQARVWRLDSEIAPFAQMSTPCHLAIFSENKTTTDLVGTGVASWRTRLLPGYDFEVVHPTGHMTGPSFILDGEQFAWTWMTEDTDDWQSPKPVEFHETPRIYQAPLKPQVSTSIPLGRVRHVDHESSNSDRPIREVESLANEIPTWQDFLNGLSHQEIPANTTRRVLIDLENYYCFYPAICVSGGKNAIIRLSWAESLYLQPEWRGSKGNRDEIEGKYFKGPADTFILDGETNRTFAPLWWRSGRYLELSISTKDKSMTIDNLSLTQTGYPLIEEAKFTCSDHELERISPFLLHSLRQCSHETYMDCPYYEQLMYVGDTRLEILVNYVMTRDHRLARKALILFYESFLKYGGGLTRSRYPSSQTQIIAPFSLWWIAMLHDYALWHDEPGLIKTMLPAVRDILAVFAATSRTGSKLAVGPAGWNFYDWVGENWLAGVPPTQKSHQYKVLPLGLDPAPAPHPDETPTSIMNFHYAMILRMASELENYVGDAQEAARYLKTAESITSELVETFWCEDKNLFSDDVKGDYYSEHAQILALLTGLLPRNMVIPLVDSLLHTQNLSRTTIYFSHYLLEVIGKLSDYNEFRQHLSLWFGLANQGFKTTPETPEPSRSDCHAWGAHPYYHFFATIAGIRPDQFGGKHFTIRPIPSLPETINGSLPLENGDLRFEFQRNGEKLESTIILPANIDATLEWNDQKVTLTTGENKLTL